MKFLALAALAIAFVGQVTSKFEFGSCPKENIGVIFDDYADVSPGNPYPHYFFAMDRGLLSTITALENFGFSSEFDVPCGELGAVEPWATMAAAQWEADESDYELEFYYDDEDIWASLFTEREDAVLSLVSAYFEPGAEFNVYYFCADTLSLPAFFEFAGAFGIEPNESLATNLNSFLTIFTKLGLNFKTHGAFVDGHPGDESTRDLGYMSRFLGAYFPNNYSVNEMTGLSKSELYCPDLDLRTYSSVGDTTYDFPFDQWLYYQDEEIEYLYDWVGDIDDEIYDDYGIIDDIDELFDDVSDLENDLYWAEDDIYDLDNRVYELECPSLDCNAPPPPI